MEHYTEIVTDVEKEMKIREYLKKRLGLSTSIIGKIKYGNVLLNSEAVHMRAVIKNGDTIDIILPEEDSESIEPIELALNIIYEDEYMLAVNKPKNMPVHPSRGNTLPTVANGILAYIGRPFVFRAINRLDRDTSGIVLIAKDRLSGAKLYRAMKDRLFKKTYIALVTGELPQNHGVINAPIAREREGEIKRAVRYDGKESITEYDVLSVNEDGSSLVRIIPHTGRTHQIRVHMAYIGHPLVGDFLYGEKIDGRTYFLHCDSLTFPHPHTGEYITLKAEI